MIEILQKYNYDIDQYFNKKNVKNFFRCHLEGLSDKRNPRKDLFQQESVCFYAVHNNKLRS